MKKMTKRTLALAMSTGMLLSNSVWAADTDADPYGAMPETVTLHVGRSEDANASYLSGQDSLNNYLVDYIKEQLNVDFVYDFSVASDYSTKVSMAIASGSIPDIMFVTASQLYMKPMHPIIYRLHMIQQMALVLKMQHLMEN